MEFLIFSPLHDQRYLNQLERKSDCLQLYYQIWINILPHLLPQCPVQNLTGIIHTIGRLEKSPYFCDAGTKNSQIDKNLRGIERVLEVMTKKNRTIYQQQERGLLRTPDDDETKDTTAKAP